ncbi:MAG TPA: hypothetical protein VGP99_11075 [Tepidisphaeraceae bacterium]|jgi:hypothetical protein|nr:hypothetical protein [Tepidisphaeraceae bacterium]
MHDEVFHPPADEIPARHEPTDINTRPLKIVAIVFLLSSIAIGGALLLLFKHYARTVVAPDRDLVDSQVRNAAPTAPEPRIQGVPTFHGAVPRADMQQLRRESQRRLSSYGKSEEQGFVRIPIDRAMQILAERQMKPTTQKSQ